MIKTQQENYLGRYFLEFIYLILHNRLKNIHNIFQLISIKYQNFSKNDPSIFENFSKLQPQMFQKADPSPKGLEFLFWIRIIILLKN